MQIRSLTKDDYDRIVSVVDHWWGGPAGERPHPVFYYELGEHALVAERDGELAGFLLGFVAPTRLPLGYVHLVGIHPDHRRQGVGRALYERFGARCQAAGARGIKAISFVGDESAARFHEALGFEVRVEEDYAGPGRARLVFRREL